MAYEITCPVCKKEKASGTSINVLPGTRCQRRRAKNKLPDQLVEFTTDAIKQDRITWASATVQPFNKYGEFSEEYYTAHGTKGIKITDSQLKKRRRVWDKAISENIDIRKTK